MTLTARHRISRRGITELARDLFGVTFSAGAIDAICQRVSDALDGAGAMVTRSNLTAISWFG